MKPPPPLLAPGRPETFIGAAAAVGNAVLRVALVPVFVTPMFDRVLSERSLSSLPGVLLAGAAVAVLGACMLFLQDAFLGRAAAAIGASWREHLYARLLGRRPGNLPGTSGGLSSRIVGDLREVEMYHQFGLGSLLAEGATILAILVLLLRYNAAATLLLLLMGLPLAVLLQRLGHRLEAHATKVQEQLEEVGSHLQEGLKHHAEVRSYRADAFMLERLRPANSSARRAGMRRSTLAALQTPVAQILMFAAVGLLVLFLVRGVLNGAMTVGELIGYLTLVALLATPMQLFPRGYALYRQASAAARRLRDLEVAEPASPRPAEGSTGAEPGLQLQQLSFAYADAAPILRDVDLLLPERGLCALAGASGTGKTTLLLLLLGFLEPTRGSISLGGTPLGQLGEEELRRAIGYAPQTSELFRASIRDNVTLGRSYSDEEAWEALASVGLVEVVEALPGRLDYELREDGAGLSGGQKQRLAVARALLGDPSVLLLDEPSASLDPESEQRLLETLQGQARERLVLVVAHQRALISGADMVLRLGSSGNLFWERPAHMPANAGTPRAS